MIIHDRIHHILHKVSVRGGGAKRINTSISVHIVGGEFLHYERTAKGIFEVNRSIEFVLTMHPPR